MIEKNIEDFPFIAEALAIELSNTLTAAETSIRAYRSRRLVARLLGEFTNKGPELVSQYMSDKLVFGRAAREYLIGLSYSQTHTQRCLLAVNENLMRLSDIADAQEKLFTMLTAKMQSAYTELKSQIDSVAGDVRRTNIFDYLLVKYNREEIHSGFSPIFKAALFIGQIENLYTGGNQEFKNYKLEEANEVIINKLQKNSLLPLTDLIKMTVTDNDPKVLTMAIYITSGKNSLMMQVLHDLLLRKYAQLDIHDVHIEETKQIKEPVSKDDFFKTGEIFTPLEIAKQIAKDLTHGQD